MGDSGKYNARVAVKYSLKKKEKNTQEECDAIINRGIMIEEDIEVSEGNIRKLYNENIKFDLYYKDWGEWSSDELGLEDMLEALNEGDEEDGYCITSFRTPEIKEIEYVDINLLKEMVSISKDLTATTDPILSVENYIYCEDDNSTMDTTDIQKIKKYLDLPDASLILTADGEGNC